MPLFVAFVNRFFSPQLSLGVIDTEGGGFHWIATPEYLKHTTGSSGVNGLCRYRGHWLVGLQATPTQLVVLDRNLSVLTRSALPQVDSLHSLCPCPDGILTVSTGTDEVFLVELDDAFRVGRVAPYWHASASGGGARDEHHVNSAALVRGEALVTMFGAKAPGGWQATQHGSLLYARSGRIVREGLHHPHTAYDLEGAWAVCESGTGKVHFEDGRIADVGGYVRGLAHDDKYLYVGVSGRRIRSRSEGTLNLGVSDRGATSCHVAVVDRRTLHVQRRIDLSAFGTEIFELAHLSEDEFPSSVRVEDARDVQIKALHEQIFDLTAAMEQEWVPVRLQRLAKKGLDRLRQKFPRGRVSRRAV